MNTATKVTDEHAVQLARMHQDITDDAIWLAGELAKRGIAVSQDVVESISRGMTQRSWHCAAREFGFAAPLISGAISHSFNEVM
jgi:hypothetical protein